MNLSKYKRIVFSVTTGSLLLVALFLFLNGTSQAARADASDLFVSSTGSGSACTQAAPCDLQTALSQSINGDTLYFAGGTYTGSGGAVVTITKSINLYGGWDGTTTTPALRDPNTYLTVLDGESLRRVIVITGTINITPTIDGFTITGGNATGLGGGLFAGSDAGGGIYSLNASPIIQRNVITGNLASTQAGVRAMGGGIYIKDAPAPATVRYNQILSNTASTGTKQGEGAGIFLEGAADIVNNTFRDNVACKSCSQAYGGGLMVGWTTDQALIAYNLFESNQAKKGAGIYLTWSAVQVSHNTIISNTATIWGAGLYSYYDRGSYINANMVKSNNSTVYGGGLSIYITKPPGPTNLINNVIINNHAGIHGGGVYANSDWNLSAITMAHNTLVGNGEGVFVNKNLTATLINNIVVSHTLGITLADPSGGILADHTLFWANTDDGMRGSNPVDGDPAFEGLSGSNHHISAASAARNTGVNAGVTVDFDGTARPKETYYDIGADEYWLSSDVYLPLVVNSSP